MPLYASRISADTPLPDLLGPDGYMRLMPAADLDAISWDHLRLWCHVNARYGLPTLELAAWLKSLFGDRSVIEIGAGAGDFCHHLGIRGTDNKCQDYPDVRAFYEATRQPVIAYPDTIEAVDALAAIERHRPDIVFASWVTHWCNPDLPPPPGGGSVYGVKEDDLLDTGVMYVMLGNKRVHQHKPILKRPHHEIDLPFLRSRAQAPALDRIFIWEPR